MALARIEKTVLSGEPLTPDSISKYRICAEIANKAVAEIVKLCLPGSDIAQICAFGDQFVHEQLAQVYNHGQVEKGPAFPTCISVNACEGNFSPLASETQFLQAGDVVKINLSVQLDGYISSLGHTHVIPAGLPTEPTRGRQADVVCAAHFAAEAVLKLLVPGTKSSDLTAVVEQIAAEFKCHPVEGTFTCNTKRFVLEGEKVALNRTSMDIEKAPFVVLDNDVFHVDVVLSTGLGRTHEGDFRTTVFQRDVSKTYMLKMAAARTLLTEVSARFPTMPFTLRSFDKRALLGLKECVEHGLLVPFTPKYEKKGEYIAQFRFTALVQQKGTTRLTGHELPFVQSLLKVETPHLQAVLQGKPLEQPSN